MEEDIKNKRQLPMKCGLSRKHHYLYVICYNKINELITKEYNDRTNTRYNKTRLNSKQ
jgi:hypothetical protein